MSHCPLLEIVTTVTDVSLGATLVKCFASDRFHTRDNEVLYKNKIKILRLPSHFPLPQLISVCVSVCVCMCVCVCEWVGACV